ncbi:conserved hypothetical protein [Methylobacterium sp. 4-46]|uniref:hypothetical protein n=1 Tax=unclassified Methylobacterium TaxID=2615210 RepID=UPI000165C92B|nr:MULTISPECIES: hypothetical protein [Methylobacterium]ACA14785.1 conserved hypothetical protein [Methylobacterium sp. 4-46]WFT80534.1 hypothetical protein QA634_01070 [Methylobacterium nodulans]
MAEPVPSPDRSRDATLAGGIAALAVAVVLVANLAPSPRPAPAAPRQQAASPAEDPTCREWTDDCTLCIRDGDAIGCTTPGIACTRGRMVCTRR